MSHKVLHACQAPEELLRDPRFRELHTVAGCFYEHLTATAGFIFRTQDLEAYVARHGQDPTLVEGGSAEFRNYADLFQRLLQQGIIYSELQQHRQGIDALIRDSYVCYRLWVQKSTEETIAS